ncbi:hypothetical protein ACIREM_40690 [Streptomyces shenzhenensis]|uniref:hypothetical protein n=1 Tax=Streptomyces shenzhenensis TaxID=943815 RepID=UPI0037FFEC15
MRGSALLAEVAQLLAPGGLGLPGAAEVGIAARVDLVLAEAPPLRSGMERAWEILAAQISDRAPASQDIAELEAADPAAFHALLETVVIAWATAPAVQALLGVAERPPIPVDKHLADPDLLAPVVLRGPRWRAEE